MKRLIEKVVIPPPVTDEEFFAREIARDKDLPELELMPVPCHDCAVVDCLYREISDRLAAQPESVREAVSRKWGCHNNPKRACRGNWDVAMAGAATEKRDE